MDRKKKFFSAEDVLLEINRSSDEENIEEESDSDESDMLVEGKDDPILYIGELLYIHI